MCGVVTFDDDRLRLKARPLELSVSVLLELKKLTIISSERDQSQLPVPAYMKAYAPNLNRWKRDARRAYVDAVWGTLSEIRRLRPRRKRDVDRRKYKRPPSYTGSHRHCIRLIRELLLMAGEKPPSDVTLRHDLTALTAGYERQH